MKLSLIKKALFFGAISGLYLTVGYLWLSTQPKDILNNFYNSSNYFSSYDLSMLSYYVFNCILLLVIFFFIQMDLIKIAKGIAVLFLLSVFSSLFWLNTAGISVFIFSIILGAEMGGWVIPYLGIVPVALFFGGVFASIFLLFKKSENRKIEDRVIHTL